ncbi:ABC transporter substrate-binding protein [Nonomuraea sp. NN258]|uniref:ABC transporter substrate-binding protein n=1 Tax=Nonomuraea antri TaxID=2730852 RepID=UPI001569912E|nr:ABC transporter substrate-binding protein [Nonomuraea antri]NRQ39978.1 ABC transporter substrate-binding protein [Nonomuraea antri]
MNSPEDEATHQEGRHAGGRKVRADTAPGYGRGRRIWHLVLAGLVALVVVAVVGVVLVLQRTPPLTDEPAAFGPDLEDVMRRIQEENGRIQRDHPDDHVTIAVLMPMTGSLTDISLDRESIRHGLQGAHLAQVWRNRRGSGAPYVKVLVGDVGPDGVEAAVDDLRARSEGERIVAVTGLGASNKTGHRAVARLSESSFAMVAAVITSDEFKPYKGLARVATLNSEQAQAAVDLARRLRPDLRAVVVRDTNRADSYVKTLGDHFTRALTDKERVEEKSFDSDTSDPGTVLANIAASICTTDANTVLYSGRSEPLPALMEGLSQQSSCIEKNVTVITGDDASQLNRESKKQMWGDLRIRLFYTALAHSEGVVQPNGPVIPAVQARFKGQDPDSYERMFGAENLDDGMAIMHHDAMGAAIAAVDKFAGKQRLPTAADVASMLTSGTVEVNGGSGPIKIGSGGERITKNVPILQLSRDGSTTFSRWVTVPGGTPAAG